MKNIDLKELSLENLATWPKPLKISIIAFCSLFILGLGYWFDISTQLDAINSAKQKELTLRTEFQQKIEQANSLPAYRQQLIKIQQRLAGMVKQLPNSTEIPSLLEDISKAGVANGLKFKLFKPLPENDLGFFIELPIQISVVGNYHQLGLFITQIAGLNRIVILQNFSIAAYKSDADKMISTSNKEIIGPEDEGLIMNITAKTYRYLDSAASVAADNTEGKANAGQK